MSSKNQPTIATEDQGYQSLVSDGTGPNLVAISLPLQPRVCETKTYCLVIIFLHFLNKIHNTGVRWHRDQSSHTQVMLDQCYYKSICGKENFQQQQVSYTGFLLNSQCKVFLKM